MNLRNRNLIVWMPIIILLALTACSGTGPGPGQVKMRTSRKRSKDRIKPHPRHQTRIKINLLPRESGSRMHRSQVMGPGMWSQIEKGCMLSTWTAPDYLS